MKYFPLGVAIAERADSLGYLYPLTRMDLVEEWHLMDTNGEFFGLKIVPVGSPMKARDLFYASCTKQLERIEDGQNWIAGQRHVHSMHCVVFRRNEKRLDLERSTARDLSNLFRVRVS